MKWFLLDSDGWLTSMGGERGLDASNRSRREYPAVFVPNGYVDVIFPEQLLDTGLLHGNAVRPFMTPEVVEVDDNFSLNVLRSMNAIPPSLTALVP